MLPNPIKYHIYTGQLLPGPWPYDYVVAHEGVIKRAQTNHFYANLLVARARIAGLRSFPANMAVLNGIPNIPARWLHSVLDHARQAGNGRGVLRPIEQMYHFHWLPSGNSGGQWKVSVPKQDASAGQVAYRGGYEASIVLDLHSHHEMAAYFSDTDNRDEQGCRFYAVIGRIYTRPEIRLRIGIYGDWLELEPMTLFDGLGPFRRAGSFDRLRMGADQGQEEARPRGWRRVRDWSGLAGIWVRENYGDELDEYIAAEFD